MHGLRPAGLLVVLIGGCSAYLGTPASDEAAVSASVPADTTWTTEESHIVGAGGPARLVGVRHAAHEAEGFDRVVFEFEDVLPDARVAYVEGPVYRCGSGEPVRLPDAGALEIRFRPAAAHDEAGQATAPHERMTVAPPAVRTLVPTCDFEGDVTWVLGVSEIAPYRVLRRAEPGRLVVDVRHPE